MDPPRHPGLRIEEVAELMQVSRMTVYRLVWSGSLAVERVGRLMRVPDSAVQAYLRGDGGPAPPTEGPVPGTGNPPRRRSA